MKKLLALPKMLLVGLLRYHHIVVAIGVILLVALVWFAGPAIGVQNKETRLVIVVGILFLWIFFLLLDRLRAERGARQLESSLQKQAKEQMVNAVPDRRGEIEALESQFEKAIASLKRSKLGRGRGSTALYALPWYMFIGPPASGKSTALLHSGLQFPYLGESGKGIQGVGGTRNCDWWFTNEAVLLDTAGRYVTEDEDRGEWFGFLDLLKQYRKKKPINGVLAAISLVDLLQATDDEVEWHAKNMRARIDELTQRLGIVFPVYLIFTKCDLLQGFVEFFEDLSKSEREQIWGCTFGRNMLSGASARAVFSMQFQNLFSSLHARKMSRLASARGSKKIKDVFGFPLQFFSAREKLSRFVEILFHPNPYHENPIFRGFYFTSGTQEGTPIDRILGSVSRASGLPEMVSEVFEEQKEPKSYFIKNLFTEIVFPDQFLAAQTTSMAKQRGYARLATFVGATLFLLISVVGLSFSFVGNKQLVGSIRATSLSASQMNVQDERQFAKNVALLDQLRSRVDQLQRYGAEGRPFRLIGLYRGDRLAPPLTRLYFERFHSLFVVPTQSAMEVELSGFVSNPKRLPKDRDSDYYYSLLKTYLMMSDPQHRDPVFLEGWLQKIWKEFLTAYYGEKGIPEGLSDSVARHISFYTRFSAQGRQIVPPFVPDARLVNETRRILKEIPVVERLYARIKKEASQGMEPYTLNVALEGAVQTLLTNDVQIPGLFTEQGWRRSFKEAAEKVFGGFGEESWVLGISDTGRSELEGEIEKLYLEEYVAHWRRFLEATHISLSGSPDEMAKMLERLGQEDSPLHALLVSVSRNTNLETKEASPAGIASGLVEKVKKGLRLGSPEEAPPPKASPSNPVSVQFRSLHEFLSSPSEGKGEAPIAVYRAELMKFSEGIRGSMQSGDGGKSLARTVTSEGGGDLRQPVRNTEKLVQRLDGNMKPLLGPLLLQPFKTAISGMMGQAQSGLNMKWKTEVYDPCSQTIARHYPFRADGEDAPLNDVADFFHPQNGILWKFYEKELKPFIDEGNSRWEVKKEVRGISFSPEFLENLRVARLISESLFPQGNSEPKIAFDLYPYPSAGVSEIFLQLDGKDFRYRNEPQEWHGFSWPGPSATQGVLLQAQTGGARQVRKYGGRWALFRLIQAGQLKPVGATKYQLEWDFTLQDSKSVKIRYDLKAESSKNPFRPGLFTGFRCLTRLG